MKTNASEGAPPPRLLTVQGAASYLGLSPWQIRGLVWANRLSHVRIGRRVYLDREDLDVLVDQCKVRPLVAPARLRRARP